MNLRKVLTIDADSTIGEGVLKGQTGKLISYDAIMNKAVLELDRKTIVTVPGDIVMQEGEAEYVDISSYRAGEEDLT